MYSAMKTQYIDQVYTVYSVYKYATCNMMLLHKKASEITCKIHVCPVIIDCTITGNCYKGLLQVPWIEMDHIKLIRSRIRKTIKHTKTEFWFVNYL